MSNSAINWALKLDLKDEPTAKYVLIVLANRADDKKNLTCWPSILQIEKDTCLSRRSIFRAIRYLEQTGLITQVGRSSESTTIFRVNVHAKPDLSGVTVAPPCQPDTGVTVAPVPHRHSTSVTVAPPPVSERHLKPNKETKEKPNTPSEREKDSAVEVFCEIFAEIREPAKYQTSTEDFIQLAKRRRTQGIPARASPPKWEIACRNYFATPQSKYTIADISNRYDVFVISPLDRYGKPVEGSREQKRQRQSIQAVKEFASEMDDDLQRNL